MDELDRLRRRYAEDHLVSPRWAEVTAAGVRCEVLEAGHGPPLVLVHGGMAHCTQWVPLIAQLEDQFRCYAVERPSNGSSDELDHAPLEDRLAHVTEVIGDLLGGIGVTAAPIMGNSLGGLYTLGFATQHPDRVEHLMLAGAPAAHDYPVPLPVRLIAGRVTGRLMQLAMSRLSPASARRGEAQLLVANPDRLSEDYLEVAAATTRRNAPVRPGYMRWAVQGRAIHPDMPASDWAATVARSGVPITYLWGTEARFVPVERGRRLASSIGASVPRDLGRRPPRWLDQPETTAQMVRTILGPAGSGGPP